MRFRKRIRIKYGRLYWLPLEADDIDKFFWVRVFRKLGIMYIPFTLRFYHELYLREDRYKYSRRLIDACRKWGITTYVVQENPVQYCRHPKEAHLPLYADLFLCPKENYELWLKEGMPKEKIRIYDMQKFDKNDYVGVFFLEPFVTWEAQGANYEFNVKLVKSITDMLDKDVVFKPHQSHPELITPILPPHRIVWDRTEELIKKYKKVYTFSNSSIVKDCEALGKEYEVVDKESLKKDKEAVQEEKIKPCNLKKTSTEDYEGVVFLQGFCTWDDIPFTWMRDYSNVKAVKAICDMLDKDVVFKPHQAHPELITHFLPPHRIIWDKAEDLIKRYKKIYAFSNSSVRKDCEMLGKKYEIVDKE